MDASHEEIAAAQQAFMSELNRMGIQAIPTALLSTQPWAAAIRAVKAIEVRRRVERDPSV